MNYYEYHFDSDPCSYDFMVWLAGCATENENKPFGVIINRATSGLFRPSQTDVYGVEAQSQMLYNVMLPATELFPVKELHLFPTERRRGIRIPYVATTFLDQLKNLKKPVASLTVPKWANKWVKEHYGHDYIAINLRTCEWRKKRNSNLEAWDKAAHILKAEREVIICPDVNAPNVLLSHRHCREAINIAIRAALYQNAYCVLGVNCGALAPAWHNSKVRYVTYKPITSECSTTLDSYINRGFTVTSDSMSSWKWAGVNQLYQIGDDTYENIMAGYERLTNARGSGDFFEPIQN